MVQDDAPEQNQLQMRTRIGNRRRRRRTIMCRYNGNHGPWAPLSEVTVLAEENTDLGGNRRRRRRTPPPPTISQTLVDKAWFGLRSVAKIRVWYVFGTKTVFEKTLYKKTWWA